MTAILELDALTSDSLRNAVGGQATMLDSFDRLSAVLREQAVEDTIVLGPSIETGVALEFCERMRRQDPTLGVILVPRRVDSNVLSAALRAGVREVLGDRDVDGLALAVNRSRELTARLRQQGTADAVVTEIGERSGRTITVFSPKGGCGKTTIATNLAVGLAMGGASVVLIDLDVAFGDVAIALGMRPEHHIGDAIDLGASLDRSALASLVATHESGLAMIVPPADPGEAERVTGDFAIGLIALLKRSYDFVVIDTAPSLDELTLSVLENSDQVLMLTTLDIASLKNIKICLDTLRLVDFPMSVIGVVLNRADASVGLDARDVAKTLNADVVAHVPSSRDVPASTNRGVALIAETPKHPVSQALAQLIDQHVAPERATRTARRGMFTRRKSA